MDISELVSEVVAPYRTGLVDRIDLRTDVPPLPRAFVDRTLIARALANIIENALFAMPSGGTLSITSAPGAGTTVRLEAPGG